MGLTEIPGMNGRELILLWGDGDGAAWRELVRTTAQRLPSPDEGSIQVVAGTTAAEQELAQALLPWLVGVEFHDPSDVPADVDDDTAMRVRGARLLYRLGQASQDALSTLVIMPSDALVPCTVALTGCTPDEAGSTEPFGARHFCRSAER